jgi:hypothetical protein
MTALLETIIALVAGIVIGASMIYVGFDPKEAFGGGIAAAIVVWALT